MAGSHPQSHTHAHSHAPHAHGHGHSHAHAHGHGNAKALAFGIALNVAFVGVEWGFGVWSHSLALMADATHNLGDVLGLVLAWVATRLSTRAPSARFTYGLGASSILAALANALLLVFITGGLLWEALLRLQNPEPVQGAVVIGVALAGVAVNGATAWLLHGGDRDDLNMKAAYLHMLGDALVSVAVAVAGAVIHFTGWQWLAQDITIVVGLVIVWAAVGLLRDSTKLALQGVPHDIDSTDVRVYLESLAGVAQVHDLHIWAISTTGTALTAHLVCPAGHPGDEFIDHACHDIAAKFGIEHVNLQVEIGDCGKGC